MDTETQDILESSSRMNGDSDVHSLPYLDENNEKCSNEVLSQLPERGELFASVHDFLESGDNSEDLSVVQEMYHAIKMMKRHTERYLTLLGFLILAVLYCLVLYFQADSYKSFQVSSAHRSLLPDGLSEVGGFSFRTPKEVYDWLDKKIIQTVWKDPTCGDGICQRPFEYESFGKFGCLSDCGKNKNISEIIVSFILSIPTEEARLQTSWNLCMTYPSSFCWYGKNKVMEDQFGRFQYVLYIPDGNWSLVLNAPFGGVDGTVVYNGSDVGESEKKADPLMTLVSLRSCVVNESATPYGKCKFLAATVANCLFNSSCFIFGEQFKRKDQMSGVFVDLLNNCDHKFSILDKFEGMNCAEIRSTVSSTSDALYKGINCQDPTESGRNLREIKTEDFLPKSQGRKLLADVYSDPSNYTESLWNTIGPDDPQRLSNLRIATQRAVYTWVAHSCLSKVPVRTTPSVVLRFSAFFCTFFGGPQNLDGCTYVSNRTGEVLRLDKDLAREMEEIHSSYGLSREQFESFSNIFLWALQSVTVLEEETVDEVNARMKQLQSFVVNETQSGCPSSMFTFSALPGQIYNYTSIFKGESITWTWMDDEPHAIRVHNGLGEAMNEIFFGFGGGNSILSRNSLCTRDNVGNGSVYIAPVPCVLKKPGATQNSFSYTKTFFETGGFSYADSRFSETSFGFIEVIDPPTLPGGGAVKSVLEVECSPRCFLRQLKDGKCDPLCNNSDCIFDGGDCSCGPNYYGHKHCDCPAGQARDKDGSCCQAFAVGQGLNFKFFISTWGPSVEESNSGIIGGESPVNLRFVSSHNRVLIGLLLSQTRWKTSACKGDKYVKLYPNCTEGKSTKNFGVNPVFLPKSKLYNPQFAKNFSAYYSNYSLGYDFSTLRNSKGIPYAFQAYNRNNVEPAFDYIFDINFDNEEATASLKYLKDGNFIDNATKSLDIQLVTYNGLENKFTLFRVMLTFTIGGQIPVTFNIQSVTTQPYRSSKDWIRFVLEIIFILVVIYSIIGEFGRYMRSYRTGGTFYSHFRRLWNILDFISIGTFIATIILWARYVLGLAGPFSTKLRYEIYDISTIDNPGQYWNIIPPGNELAAALDIFHHIDELDFFRTYYTALNGISVLLLLMRILKYMDFQPRMGSITRTLEAATPDLTHFFIMFSVFYFGFAMYGHLVFGRTLDKFRTLPISLVTCFSSILRDDSIVDFLLQLKGWELISGIIFWWSFTIIMIFIVFNILIAIIVEASGKVREKFGDAPSITTEVAWLLHQRTLRIFSKIKTDKRLLSQLQILGADRNQELEKEREEWLLSFGRQNESDEEKDEVRRERIKVGGKELAFNDLVKILEKGLHQAKESMPSDLREVTALDLCKVIFEHHKMVYPEEGSPKEHDNTLTQLMDDVHLMKNDATEMIASLTKFLEKKSR